MTNVEKPNVRDFEADRAIAEAATVGPYEITPCACGRCSQVFISITSSDGRLEPEDARFIAEARTGWLAALDRIAELEAENKRLKSDLLAAHIDERTAYVSAETYYNEIQRYRQALESIANASPHAIVYVRQKAEEALVHG